MHAAQMETRSNPETDVCRTPKRGDVLLLVVTAIADDRD